MSNRQADFAGNVHLGEWIGAVAQAVRIENSKASPVVDRELIVLGKTDVSLLLLGTYKEAVFVGNDARRLGNTSDACVGNAPIDFLKIKCILFPGFRFRWNHLLGDG